MSEETTSRGKLAIQEGKRAGKQAWREYPRTGLGRGQLYALVLAGAVCLIAGAIALDPKVLIIGAVCLPIALFTLLRTR